MNTTESPPAGLAAQQLCLQATALELAANPVLITDAAGRILWVNPAFTTLTGYPAEEVVGKTPRLLKSGQHDAAFYQNFWQTILAGQTWRGEFTNRRKDGSLFCDEHTVTPIREAGGKITHFIGVMHDVTARTQAETQLLGSEAQYRRLFESAKDGILILNAETGMIEDVNLYLTELLGFTREQFLRKKVWELGFLQNMVASQEKFHELQRVGYVRYEDLPLEGADGRKVAVEFVSNVYEVNGAQVIQCNIRNITERKRAEAALRASENHFRLLYENSPYCIHEIDREGRLLLMNRAGLKLMGVQKESAICGKPYLSAVADEDQERIDRLLRLAFQGQTCEFDFKASNGLIFQSSLVPITDAQGAVVRLMGLTLNITERKQAEEVLKHRVVELERFHRLSVGRELQMIDLKQEVNELSRLAGRPPPYDLSFLERKLEPQNQTPP